MWKFVARGIRESLERRTSYRTNVCPQNPQDGNDKNDMKTSLVCNRKLFTPSFSAFASELFGFTRARGTKDKKQDSKFNSTRHDWAEAVGWSSVLALGWVVSQSLCFKRKIFEKDQHQDTHHKKLLQLPEVHVKHLLAQVLNLKPQFVLPTAHCISNGDEDVNQATNENLSQLGTSGFLTAGESLNKAGSAFVETHRLASGEYELRLGIIALKDKRYEDALRNFANGAKLLSAGSIYNLGLCHELGLGTVTDNNKAAKYYRKAAEMGHPDAIYNLAIFYAQGRGDFNIDFDKARILFKRAADLGQEKAKEALTLEARFEADSILDDSQSLLNSKTSSLNKTRNSIKKNFFNYFKKYDNVLVSNPSEKYNNFYTDERIQKESEDATQIFLKLLGINEEPAVNTISESSL